MSISVQCPGCKKKLTGKDELAGKRVKCPGCGQPVALPGRGRQDRPNGGGAQSDASGPLARGSGGLGVALWAAIWGSWAILFAVALIMLVLDISRVQESCDLSWGEKTHGVSGERTITTAYGTVTFVFKNGRDTRDLFKQIQDYWTLSKKPRLIAFALLLLVGVGLVVFQMYRAVQDRRPTATAAPAANAASLVLGPALALLAVGILDIVVGVVSLLLLPFIAGVLNSAAWLFLGSLIIMGAMKMKKRKSYGFAMTACILAMVPVFNICVLGLPFGIWGLVVLLKPGVNAAFAATSVSGAAIAPSSISGPAIALLVVGIIDIVLGVLILCFHGHLLATGGGKYAAGNLEFTFNVVVVAISGIWAFIVGPLLFIVRPFLTRGGMGMKRRAPLAPV